MRLYKSIIQTSLLHVHAATKLTHFETALAVFNLDAKSSKKFSITSKPQFKQAHVIKNHGQKKAIKTMIHEDRHSFHENDHASNSNSCWTT